MIRRVLFWAGEFVGALCVFAIPYCLAVFGWAFTGG